MVQSRPYEKHMDQARFTLSPLPDEEAERGVLDALNRVRRAHGLAPRSESLWRWRTRENPGGACLGVARGENGRVLAGIIGVKHRVRLEGSQASFLEIVDAFNDFEASQGLARAKSYVRLGEAFARAFGGTGPEKSSVMWGIPNRRAHRIGLAGHGHEILRSENMLGTELRRFVLGGAPDVEIEDADSFPTEVETLFERFAHGRGALLARDRTRLDWRFTRHPERRYHIAFARRRGELAGYAVLRVGDWNNLTGAILVDWCVPLEERGAASALLGWGAVRARREGATRLVANLPDKSPEWGFFQDHGFRVFGTDEYLVFRGFQKPYVMSWLFANWFYTLGDGERG